MIRRTAILAACTVVLGLGLVGYNAVPLFAEDAPAATGDKSVDMTAMKESMMKVDAEMMKPSEMKDMHKEMMRMQMIHEMMMNDPACKDACKKMTDDMKMKSDEMKMSDDDMMKMKKEIANESAKNEEVMKMMMTHMMAKDSMMMKDQDMKDKDAAK